MWPTSQGEGDSSGFRVVNPLNWESFCKNTEVHSQPGSANVAPLEENPEPHFRGPLSETDLPQNILQSTSLPEYPERDSKELLTCGVISVRIIEFCYCV